MKKAEKSDWMISDESFDFIDLPKTNKEFKKIEYNKIINGLIPLCMKDKWFIYSELNKVYIIRSWTGILMYEVLFQEKEESVYIERIRLNKKIYKPDYKINYEHEKDLCVYIIDSLLLEKDTIY